MKHPLVYFLLCLITTVVFPGCGGQDPVIGPWMPVAEKNHEDLILRFEADHTVHYILLSLQIDPGPDPDLGKLKQQLEFEKQEKTRIKGEKWKWTRKGEIYQVIRQSSKPETRYYKIISGKLRMCDKNGGNLQHEWVSGIVNTQSK